MQRRLVLIGLVGVLAAATAAHAQTPKEVTLFGKKYVLESHSLGGQYANGLTVVLPPDDNKGADVHFVPGETPERDRLFVATAFTNDETIVAHQFYLLTGADANGIFNQKTSNLTEFFGGAKDRDRGGRIATVTWISDVDTGLKQDRNIVLTTFTGDDYLRFYDLDTLTGDYIGDAVLSIVQRCINADEGDPGMPACGFVSGARVPNANLLIFVGRGEGEGPQIGIMDPNQNKFFNVLTNLGTVTESQTIPYDINLDPQDFEHYAGDQYLILGSEPSGLGSDRTRQVLYLVRITPPADPAKAEPGSIKAEILAAEELLNEDEGKNLLGVGPGGVVGIAVGREVTNGLRRLYFSTRNGTLITATPVAQ